MPLTTLFALLATNTPTASYWPVSFLLSTSIANYISAVAGLIVLKVRPHYAAQLLRPLSYC